MGNLNHLQLRKMPCMMLFFIALMALVTVSCLDKDVYQGITDDGNVDSSSANLFDYSTTKSVTINLDYLKNYEVPFEIYYSNPIKEDGTKDKSKEPFISGKTDSNGKFTIKYDAFPIGRNELFVYSPTLTVESVLQAQIEGEVVNFVSTESDVSTHSETRVTGDYYTGWNSRNCDYSTLGGWDKNGNPDYINPVGEKYKLKVTDKFLRTIEHTLNSENLSYGMFLTHEHIEISERANVFVNFVSHREDNEHKNALAYYTLAPDHAEPTIAPVNLTVAFPNLKADRLQKGDVIQLKYEGENEFPVGSRIGFVLLKDAFQDGNLEKNVNLMYSSKRYNSYTIKRSADGDGSIAADRPQMFAFMADENLVISFEDMPWHERRKAGQEAHGDFSDDVFTITANPIKALPDDVNPGIDPEEDSEEEEKPDLTINSVGILAFEDNWPKAGDYDLNDVVFDYQRTYNIKGNEDFSLISIDEIYTFRHDGATYKNGFGYEMGGNIRREDVEVTVTSDNSIVSHGLDMDLEKATVMLSGNIKELKEGTRFKVHTRFKKGTNYTYSQMNLTTPYNPFIVSMGYNNNGDFLADNRVEVHLPKNFAPTPKADKTKFGTENDMSLVDGSKYYYIRSGDYPFALEIVGAFGTTDIPNFRIPEENVVIDVTYPKFKDWVANPSKNADWWKY